MYLYNAYYTVTHISYRSDGLTLALMFRWHVYELTWFARGGGGSDGIKSELDLANTYSGHWVWETMITMAFQRL